MEPETDRALRMPDPMMRVGAVVVALAVAGVLPEPVQGQTTPSSPSPDILDLRYGPDARHLLDLYRPAGSDSAPLVVWFPGGGFIESRKELLYPAWVNGLLEQGIAVASVQYRLAPRYPLPAAFHDAKRAIQFLKLNADRYRIDRERVAAVGNSAGGGLSLWLALHDDLATAGSSDPAERESTRLACAVGLGAQASYDPRFWIANGLGRALREEPFSLMWGLEPGALADHPFDDEQLLAVAEEVSPINHVSPDDPPILLIHTVPDEPVTDASPGWLVVHHPLNGQLLGRELSSAGVHVELVQQQPALGRFDSALSAKSIEFLTACLTRTPA